MDHHGKTIDVDTKTTMEEYPYGELFLKKSMAQELTLKSPRNATKTTRMTKTTSGKSDKSGENSKNNNTQERAKSIFWVTIRKSGGF